MGLQDKNGAPAPNGRKLIISNTHQSTAYKDCMNKLRRDPSLKDKYYKALYKAYSIPTRRL